MNEYMSSSLSSFSLLNLSSWYFIFASISSILFQISLICLGYYFLSIYVLNSVSSLSLSISSSDNSIILSSISRLSFLFMYFELLSFKIFSLYIFLSYMFTMCLLSLVTLMISSFILTSKSSLSFLYVWIFSVGAALVLLKSTLFIVHVPLSLPYFLDGILYYRMLLFSLTVIELHRSYFSIIIFFCGR